MKLKIFLLTCYEKGRGNISHFEDMELTEKKINDFCKDKEILSIFPFDDYYVMVVYK